MEDSNTGKGKNTKLYAIIAVVVVAVIAVVLFFVFSGSGVKGETITADNYQEILTRVQEEIKDDDLYYVSFAIGYHSMKDYMEASLSGEADENAMYKNIYGKTVQQLIDEGKQLMEENNLTIDQIKEQIEDSSLLNN